MEHKPVSFPAVVLVVIILFLLTWWYDAAKGESHDPAPSPTEVIDGGH